MSKQKDAEETTKDQYISVKTDGGVQKPPWGTAMMESRLENTYMAKNVKKLPKS